MAPKLLAMAQPVDQETVSLLRWLRRQLRQPTPERERLEAAVANDDPAEARRLLRQYDFGDAQRRHVEGLIDRWEEKVDEPWPALRTRHWFDTSSPPSHRGAVSRSAASSPTTRPGPCQAAAPMAGTFVGRQEIFAFLGRLPKETNGTYSSALIDVLASDDRAAALYRATGERHGRQLELDQVLLFRIENGLVQEVLALPSDPAEFDRFWA